MKIVVIGAGLAGAACAYALAQRGQEVQVIQHGAAASELAVGMLVPHHSWQDVEISQLSRLGVSCTLAQARALLREGMDWQPCPVRQKLLDTPQRNARLIEAARKLPDWLEVAGDELIHLQAAWIAPQALVQAWLRRPGIALQTASVAGLRFDEAIEQWQVLDAQGRVIAQAEHVILANGIGCEALVRSVGLQLNVSEVAGQVAMGHWPLDEGAVALNGNGHFMAGMPASLSSSLSSDEHPAMWLSGSTYERPPFALPQAHQRAGLQTNLARLTDLLPEHALQLLQAQLKDGQGHSWEGIRCTTSDRLPVVGQLAAGLHISTAMGSRGLSFAALCGQWLVEQILYDAPSSSDEPSAEASAWMPQLRPDRRTLRL
jgi:tRNA 5-methylaminomethyl-2-thiouridine biosynthesis bifunctional protein